MTASEQPAAAGQTVVRTLDEIAQRARGYDAPNWTDWIGNRRSVLLGYLDFERAKPSLNDDVTAASWADSQADAANVGAESAAYLAFAFDKARDHRGLSASRSVEKLAEWAWLMGHNDLFQQMHADENYAQYGVPALVLFARRFDLPIPAGDDLARMAKGEPCEPGCQDGCGR